MAKKTTNTKAADPKLESAPQQDAPVPVITDASDPSGKNGPDGTHTTASESGAAAGSVSTDQVKPHDQDGTSTPVTVTDATNGQSAPDAEAAASGGSEKVSEPSQGGEPGGVGAAAGATGVLSQASADAILAQILGVSPPIERRTFAVFEAVRHNNTKIKAGGFLDLTEIEHARLFAKGIVDPWDAVVIGEENGDA